MSFSKLEKEAIKKYAELNGYDLENRGDDFELSRGTPEHGQTLILDKNGNVTEYANGDEYIECWELDSNNNLVFC